MISSYFCFTGQSSYKIKKKIGEGGFAKVFVAESEDLDFDTLVLCSQTNKEKAIKVLFLLLLSFLNSLGSELDII